MTANELRIAKILFVFLILNIAVTIICDSYTGIIKAHEKFKLMLGLPTSNKKIQFQVNIIYGQLDR